MRAVAASRRAQGQHDSSALWDALDLVFKDPELGRIDEVIGTIDREKRRANLFQLRPRVIVVGSLHLVQPVIGVLSLQPVVDSSVKNSVALRKRGHLLLTQNRITRYQEAYFRCDTEALWLG